MCSNTPSNKSLFILVMSLLVSSCGESGENSVDVPDIVENSAFTQDIVSYSENTIDGEEIPCEMTGLDVALLEEINEARANARMCGDEFKVAVEPLNWSCQLKEAGLVHSVDMGTYNFFSHTGSDGLNVGHRTTATGYPWIRVGENIAAGFDTVETAVQGWLDSPSHCQTLMSDRYEDLGVGFHFKADTRYGTYWTMVVGKPSAL